MAYQPFNDLPASQFQMLRNDIEQRGIVNPIIVDENGKTIDGHQRRRAAAELGIECPRVVIEGLTDDEKMALAIALNTFRRHLSGVERSQQILALSNLGLSQRRIAEATGVSPRTVRRDLQAAGGADAPPENVDRETGEITDSSSSGQSEGATSDAAAPGDDEHGDAPAPSPEPKPAPRVLGKDGKSYPASKPKAATDLEDEVSRSDVGYRAATSKEFSKVRSGLLTLDAQRVAAVCLAEDRAAYLAFAEDVGTWALELKTWLEGDTRLRSVK